MRLRLVLCASLAMLLFGAGTSQAAIQIIESSESATVLGEVRKGKCKVKRRASGRVFHATGKTTNGAYTLGVDIYDFRGFGPDYNVPYGVINPTVDVEGAAGDFSNNYPFPGAQPPGGAGAIAFSRRGARLGLGIYALPNPDYSRGVAVAGHMKCIYPRR